MEFIEHTVAWVKGEIFEATIFGSFGLLTIILSGILWKFGVTPSAQALVLPLLLVGLFFAITAISGIRSNKKRLPEYSEAYQKDKAEFIKSEKARVEGFQYLYKMTIVIATVSFILAICSFLFTISPVLRGIGIALAIFGLTGLVIDYFSKERADIYYQVIKNELKC